MADPRTPIRDCTFVAFDTETTGTGPGARLVEIAGARFRGDEFLGRFDTLIDPGVPIPEESTAVHQITDDMVAGKPKAGEVLTDFFAFAEDAVLVAHNAEFDASIIGLELTRLRRPAPENLILDSLKAARRVFPGQAAHSLDALIELIGIPPQEERHRAFADAELVRHLVRRMAEAIGGDAKPLDALMEHSGRETLAPYLLAFPELAPELRHLEKACREGTKANLHIQTGGAKPKQQIVHPKLCYTWNADAFLEAMVPEDGHDRLFRLDRIVKAEPGASSGFLF